jgi:hypothetical protein
MKSNAAIQTKNFSTTPTDLNGDALVEISDALRKMLAEVFALYVKTKNFHWHMSGKHFRDYHLLLDEQGSQVFAMTDDIAEWARMIGGTTLRSISDISKHQGLKDNHAEFVAHKSALDILGLSVFGGDFKEPDMARLADIISVVHKSNNSWPSHDIECFEIESARFQLVGKDQQRG